VTNNSTVAKLPGTEWYLEAYDPYEFRMGMPYAYIRILDNSGEVYLDLPDIWFYPGSAAQDFLCCYADGLLSLNALLKKEQQYQGKSVVIDLPNRKCRIKAVGHAEEEFVPICEALDSWKSMQSQK